ncbi:MAG TPA: tetratricopeptide repeat protein, partial [Pseudomonadales bacterium]
LLWLPSLWAAQPPLSPPFYRYYQFLEYTGQPSPVIGSILKDQKLGRLKDHERPVKLTLARLYIALGLHLQAVNILRSLAQQTLPAELADQVWFYLASSHYHSGDLQQAEQALQRIHRKSRSPQIRAQQQHLQALILMAGQHYRQAAEMMQKNWWQAPDNWDLYQRFNLAVALINSNRQQQGLELLQQTSLKPAENKEAEALIDKINQTLGYVLLQQQQPAQARPYLERVRLRGPYSDMALLGTGWASAMLQQYRQALVPWLELSARDIRQVPVQEALLTVPYAYEQLDAWGQAAQFYQQAIDDFEAEIQHLQQSREALKNNVMQQVLAGVNVASEAAWLKNIHLIDDQPATRYIRQLMDDDDFFNTMNNYREARFILREAEGRMQRIKTLTGDRFSQLVRQQTQAGTDNREQIRFMEILAADLFRRANQLMLQAQQQIDSHGKRLQQRALQLLEQRKAHIDVYLVQARLALAQCYDRLGDGK